ncbi:unnamed protein product [Rhodiola kirilowii]
MEKSIKIESLDPNAYPRSPKFEFWMVVPQPNLLTADELFADGVLVPLDLVPVSVNPSESVVAESATSQVSAGPELTATAVEPASGSRRWKDIFRKSESKAVRESADSATLKIKRERRTTSGGGGGGAHASSAELNINIWPFSRSRSAGTSGTRPKIANATRKVSSAPCSRSNSGGESKSRRWAVSPARPGVNVGKSNPVWQVRRGGSSPMLRPSSISETTYDRKSGIPSGGKEKILKGCKQVVASPANGGDIGSGGWTRMRSGGSNEGSGSSNRFNLRSLFSKKVY